MSEQNEKPKAKQQTLPAKPKPWNCALTVIETRGKYEVIGVWFRGDETRVRVLFSSDSVAIALADLASRNARFASALLAGVPVEVPEP